MNQQDRLLECPHCKRAFKKNAAVGHVPACSPEAREAKRLRVNEFARRYRERTRPTRAQKFRGWSIPDVYLSRPGDIDSCPSCAGPKTKKAVVCIACRRALGRRRRPLPERFWEKVDASGSCWPFRSSNDVHGYGRISIKRGDVRLADRVSWELTYGPIRNGLFVLHRCDNPPCVRPDHLFLGTQADNIADMIAKGRAAWQRKVG